MNGSRRNGQPGSGSGPSVVGSTNAGDISPPKTSLPAAMSAAMPLVRTQRFLYRAPPSPSNQMPCTIASPSIGNV